MVHMQQQRFDGYSGVSLAADVGGSVELPAVVLMHGGGQTRLSWGATAQTLLTRGYRVLSLDLRGHGDSDWAPDCDYTLDAFVGDLRAVLRTLPRPPTIVGASLGGVTALLAIGETASQLASSLVLVDIVPRIDLEGAARITGFMTANPQGFATVEEAAEAVAAYLPHRPRPKDISGLRKNLRVGPDQRLHWHWDPRFISGHRRDDIHETRSRMEAAAHHVRIPTLLVRGEHSEIVTSGGAESLLEQIPGAEFVDVAGARHMLAGDENDAFSVAVLDFLERHVPR